MKTYDQRMEAILKKAKARKLFRACLKTVTSVLCMVAIIFGFMHIPYGQINAAFTPTAPNLSTEPSNQNEPTSSNTEGPPVEDMPTNPTQPCEPDGKEHISVTLWVPHGLTQITQIQIERFNQNNSLSVVIDATVEEVWYYDADDYIAADPENAPDLYCFRQDQLTRLLELNALHELSVSDSQWVKENNLPFTVGTACSDDTVFAFPISYQDANLLYYDKSVISEEDTKSLLKILAACKRADKKFCMDLAYTDIFATFFLATGCDSQWYLDADGNYSLIADNFNSAQGKYALLGMTHVLNSQTWVTIDRNGMTSNLIMEEVYNQSAAVIAGHWNYGMIAQAMGDNLCITTLPSFQEYDEAYQMKTYADSVMMGITPQEDAEKEAVLAELARYLAGEECQLERYEWVYWMIPTNLTVLAQLEESDPLIAALVAQSQYAVPNLLPAGLTAWWDIADDILTQLQHTGLTPEMVLKLYAQNLEDILDPPTGIWSVYDGYLDIDMVQQADGTWRTKEPLYLSEKDGFIVRYEHSYDQACYQQSELGYSYWKPGVAGYYHIFFDPVAWQCTWVNCENTVNMPGSGKAVRIWDIMDDSDDEIQSAFSVHIPELNNARIEYDMSESEIYVDGEYLLGGPGYGCVAFYLSDLTGDGCPELCFVMALGSGIVDVNIVIIDYATKNTVFSLSDRGFHDYYLFVKDGVLCVKETEYLKYDAVRTGVLAYNGTDISVVWDN